MVDNRNLQPPSEYGPHGVSISGNLVIGDNSVFIGVLQYQAGAGDSFAQQLLRTYDAQSRETLLEALGAYLRGTEEHSLQRELRRGFGNDIRLPVTFTTAPQLVDTRWLPQWERRPEPVAADADALQLFRDKQGLLLLVGSAGAGKTTFLLGLLTRLVVEARRDAGAGAYGQVPLLLPLSQRARKPKVSFKDWLAEEASDRYNVSADVVRGWLRTGQLILLLDDLTGMRDQQRLQCIEEINQLRSSHGSNRLVVACRPEDLPERPRLKLRAVQVDSMAPSAVEDALTSLGEAGTGLREAHARSPSLQELLRVPLMLTLAALAFRDRPTPEIVLPRPLEAAQDFLLDAYVGVMVNAQERDQQFSVPETLYYTASLASILERTGSRELLSLPEPEWLQEGRTRAWVQGRLRIAVSAVVSVLTALIAFTIFGWLGLFFGVMAWGLLARDLRGSERPRQWLAEPQELGDDQFEFSPRHLLNSPKRLLFSLLGVVLSVTLFLVAQQHPDNIRRLPALFRWTPIWAPAFALLVVVCCMFKEVPVEAQEFEERSSLETLNDATGGTSTWRTDVAYFFRYFRNFAVLGLPPALLMLPVLTLTHWLMGLDVFQALTLRNLDENATFISRLTLPGIQLADRSFSEAPLGQHYLHLQWPFLAASIIGACFALMGMAQGFLGMATNAMTLLRSHREDLTPKDYPGFLIHATRLTFLQQSQGRWTFTHETIRRFFAEHLQQYELEWRDVDGAAPAADDAGPV